MSHRSRGSCVYRAIASCLLGGTLAAAEVSPVDAQLPWGEPLGWHGTPDGGAPFYELVLYGTGSLGGFAGLATIANGVPTILYDPAWVGAMGGVFSPGFRFIRAHEYGHHRLYHPMAYISAPPVMLPGINYQSELDADCWAVRVLDMNGDYEAVEAAFMIYQSVLPPYDQEGRSGAVNRVNNMNWCLQN